MSQREFDLLLKDVRDASAAILRYADGKSLNDYVADEMLRDAIERRFMIIGEALNQARKARPDFTVAGMRGIIGFRHVLVHAYHAIEPVEVWHVIENDLPLLLDEVRLLLGPTPA